MLSRASRRLSSLYSHQHRNFASGTAAYDSFNDRINKLKSQYPNFYDGNKFMSEQESLLNTYKSSLSSVLSDYDVARQKIDEATGEAVFSAISEDELLSDIDTKHRPFYNTLSADMDDIASKLAVGKEYVDIIVDLQEQRASSSKIEEQNLKMMEISNYGDKLDQWKLTFPDKLKDSSDLGLPISDDEVDEWVRKQYHHAPDEVREQGGQDYDAHKKVEETWMKTLDDKLVDLLKERDSNLDENKFREFCNKTNELFHPHNIDHYTMSNYAKSLFRAALWQQESRCADVEESINIVYELLIKKTDNDSEIMRTLYEQYPDTRFSNFIAGQLSITDPLFAAKLIEETRNTLEQVAIDRAIKDTLYDLEMPFLNEERSSLETELEESQSTNPVNMQRGIRALAAEQESYDLELASLEDVLDELLPRKLWNNDISLVKQAIISYSSGSGSLSDIDSAIQSSLSPSFTEDLSSLTDSEILDISVKFHNARTSNVERYNFSDFLFNSQQKKDLASKIMNRRIAKRILDDLGVDPLVINLTRVLIEDGKGVELEKVCIDYKNIMKRHRGEIDGSITSATELSDDQYNQIENALSTSNPGKKITLARMVDVGLQSGFIVKAGVQRFDFSLATVVHQGRLNVGTV